MYYEDEFDHLHDVWILITKPVVLLKKIKIKFFNELISYTVYKTYL